MKSTRKIPVIGDGTWTTIIPFALITSCFALWGFANDITTPLVKAFSKILRCYQRYRPPNNGKL